MEERLLALMDRYGLRKPAANRWQVLIQSFSAGEPAEDPPARPVAAADPVNSIFDMS